MTTEVAPRYRLKITRAGVSFDVSPVAISPTSEEIVSPDAGELHEGLPNPSPKRPRSIVVRISPCHLQFSELASLLQSAPTRDELEADPIQVVVEKRWGEIDEYRPVRMGRLSAIWTYEGETLLGLRDCISTEFKDEEPKDLKVGWVLLMSLLVWVFKWIDFWQRHSYGTHTAHDTFAFLNLFHIDNPGGDWHAWGHNLVMAFLVFHSTRMFLGIEFAAYDSAFQRAKELASNEEDRHRKKWRETFLLTLIAAMSVLTSYAVGLESPWPVLCLLLVQGFVVLRYNVVFSEEFGKWHSEKGKMTFVRGNDYLFFLTMIVFAILAIAESQDSSIQSELVPAAIFLATIHIGVFFIELRFYLDSLGKTVRYTWKAMNASH